MLHYVVHKTRRIKSEPEGVYEALSIWLLANGESVVRQTKDASYSFRWMKQSLGITRP